MFSGADGSVSRASGDGVKTIVNSEQEREIRIGQGGWFGLRGALGDSEDLELY